MTDNELSDESHESSHSGPPAELARWTGFLLSWVAASGTEHYTRALAEVGLTAHQLGVLELVRPGPLMQARLSEQLHVFKPVMVTLVNELAAQGLVERRPHPRDRRAVEIHLLPAGAARLAQAHEVSTRASAQFFAALTPAEQQVLHGLLTRLADHAGGPPPAPGQVGTTPA